MTPEPIETPRLVIRRFTPEDAPFILKLLNEPGWLRFIGDRGIRSVEGARAYIESVPMASYEKHGFGLSAVEIKESGALAGMAGLIRREGLEHVDVGFALLEEHMGRGYAREAAEAVVAQGWSVFGLPRIVAITTTDNTRSIRLLESMGFRFVKVFRMPDDDEDLNLYAMDRPGAPAPKAGLPPAPSGRSEDA